MKKFFAIVILVAGSFALGFYFGQRPVGTLQKTVADLEQSAKDLSKSAMDTAMGIERDLRRRQALVEAKSRLVQAKADIFDRNFGEAAKELAEGVEALESATKGGKSEEATNEVRELTGLLKEARLDLAMGKPVPLKKLDEIQLGIDRILNK
jgi:hypothetical protein